MEINPSGYDWVRSELIWILNWVIFIQSFLFIVRFFGYWVSIHVFCYKHYQNYCLDYKDFPETSLCLYE